MEIALTFLGTSNAFPTKERNHPAMLLDFAGERILIDCGEGTQRQFRKANINPCKLTRIFLTHLHGDHVLGLPGLLATLSLSEYSRNLQIYGPRGTSLHIETLEKIYGKFGIKKQVHESVKIKDKDFVTETSSMSHGIPTLAYSITIGEKTRLDKKKIAKLKLPNSPILAQLAAGKDITINGKKIKASQVTYKQQGKKITVIMDTAMNNNAISLAKNSDLLVCESTYEAGEEKTALEHKHLTVTQAAQIAKKAKVKRLVLTHISQRYEHKLDELERQAKKIFKNTTIAKDLEIYRI